MLKRFQFVVLCAACSLVSTTVLAQKTCVDLLMDELHIDKTMQSDPGKVRETLENMGLDGFDLSEEIFADFLSKSVDLAPFFAEVRHAILMKHPAIEEFLCRAFEQNLILVSDALHENVEATIYTTLLLNRLTEEMSDDISVMYDIREHYIQKREVALGKKRGTFGYWWAINKHAGGLFEILKTATMDSVYNQYIQFRETGELNRTDLLKKNTGLRVNIMEAVLKDVKSGFLNNANVGWKLINSPMIDIYTDGENKVVKQIFEESWTDLYETWNLAFVTGNMNDLHMIYPKLLIPRVINATEADYLFDRGISLWVTVNMVLLRRIAGIEEVVMPNTRELADLFGEVNLDFANCIDF